MSWQPAKEPICTEDAGSVALTIEGRARDIGGMEVRRVLPSSRRRLVGPFIFFDEMGPADIEPGGGIQVRPHPHIGLATITWLFEGEIMHRDSLGFVQAIRPGAVNLMTAGRGIAHSERSTPEVQAKGGSLHGIQAWMVLPLDKEESEPAFVHVEAGKLPVIERDGARLHLILGEAYGEQSPVEIAAPAFYVEAHLPAGSSLPMPDEQEERAVYVVSGSLLAGGQTIEAGTMAVFEESEAAWLEAETDCRLMLLGGDHVPEKRHIWWNFVSSRPERIEQAKADWREGRFAKVVDDDEFIPLPND